MVDDLESLLFSRAVPAAPPNLAARIILAAPPRRTLRPHHAFRQPMAEVLREFFMLPRPAFVMSLTVLCGVVLGLSAGISHIDHQDSDLKALYSPDFPSTEDLL